MPEVVKTSLYVHCNEFTHAILESLHLIDLAIILKHPILVAFAADFVPKGIVIPAIIVDT